VTNDTEDVMRETFFRFAAAVLASAILAIGGVLLVTDATLVGSAMDALWMGGVSLLLFSAFTVMAISGPKRAHEILVKGMRMLRMVGDEPVPERLGRGRGSGEGLPEDAGGGAGEESPE
jgi:hypothetical protein